MSKDAQRTHDQGCQMVIFRPKNTILGVSILEVLGTENVNRYIPWPFGIYCVHFVIFNGHLVHFWSFGIFPVWVCCTKKNLATLLPGSLSKLRWKEFEDCSQRQANFVSEPISRKKGLVKSIFSSE
jgi:hypothetical protein